jgi:hypothetical protein
VEYVATTDMLADGLIKALGIDKFLEFRKQIGVVDIAKLIAIRRLKELSVDDLDKLENCFIGGEAEI